ncbi:uncharacterized protein [Amphiura filiformis]|uniref:uncharacterized protein n=1 Tax=Amphiura filiformis TaxID=82378 RepID=UPI003B20ED6F
MGSNKYMSVSRCHWLLVGVLLMSCSKFGNAHDVECPVDWEEFDNFCYFLDNTLRSYDDAQADCVANGATLTSIISSLEQTFINTNFLVSAGINIWIGLIDKMTEGTLEWEDGNTYVAADSNFRAGQPDNGAGGDEDCMHVYDNGEWNDVPCSTTLGYICKMKRTHFRIESAQYIGKEGSMLSITVHRDGLIANNDEITLTADVPTTDTATYGTDYSSDTGATETLTFNPGDETVTVDYTLTADDDLDDLMFFTLTLALSGATMTGSTAGVYASLGSPSVTQVFIHDCSFMFWIDPVYIGDECDTMVEVVVHRCGYLGNTDDKVEIYTSTTGVTATAADFTEITMAAATDPVDTEVSFAKGDCAVAHQLSLTPDDVVEGMEYFEVVIDRVTGTNAAKGTVHTVLDTAKVFILDHSTIFWIDPIYVGEEDSMISIYVHRTGFVGDPATVALSLGTPATATLTDDYTVGTVPVVFADGDIVKEVVIDLKADDDIEDTEYVTVTLGTITVASATKTALDAARDTATIFILDRSCKLYPKNVLG